MFVYLHTLHYITNNYDIRMFMYCMLCEYKMLDMHMQTSTHLHMLYSGNNGGIKHWWIELLDYLEDGEWPNNGKWMLKIL